MPLPRLQGLSLAPPRMPRGAPTAQRTSERPPVPDGAGGGAQRAEEPGNRKRPGLPKAVIICLGQSMHRWF